MDSPNSHHYNYCQPEGTLQFEAEYVKQDIRFAVEYIDISSSLPYKEDVVYLNLETKEKEKYCIELTSQGFHIISQKFDTVENEENGIYYETIYALLDSISPQYRQLFGESLAAKLAAHVQPLENENEEIRNDNI